MRAIARSWIIAAICIPLLGATQAQAQQHCPEGRAANGACVNPVLGAMVRQIGVIFSQPKISQTAYPVLPSGDQRYRYPNALVSNPVQPTPCCGPPIP
jgi:hypothetical protein